MAESTITVNLKCPCGGILQTEEDIPTDETAVFCKDCGEAFGIYGEVIAHARNLATEKASEVVTAELKKAFKGMSRTITSDSNLKNQLEIAAAMGYARHNGDEHRNMYDCVLCDQKFQFGPHAYLGRPIKSWGDVMICHICESANWDGIVLERHSRLSLHFQKIGVQPVVNTKGWLPIPPR